jgi:nicotinamidase-related amidase
MASARQNVSGNDHRTCPCALLLIDVINDLDFGEGERMLQFALPMARKISVLKRAAHKLRIPVIYVNDNFGRWQSDFKKLVSHCLESDCLGRAIAKLLRPGPRDYFVLKPKHSGFYSTSLGILLEYLESRTLILTGIAGNNCVLFTANDAYMREYKLIVPPDCIASNTPEQNEAALEQMRTILKAKTTLSDEIDLKRLARR